MSFCEGLWFDIVIAWQFHNEPEEGNSMAMQHSNDEQESDLLIRIHPQLHRKIILEAAKANLSVQDYVERILEQNVSQERERGLNKEAIDDLFRLREQIKRNHPGQVFEDSAEQLHQIREERMRELEGIFFSYNRD